ncbi:MAG: methylenetetrahydrofolate reductase [Actinomycetota bacterium]|nr:methylenetetrahydrofolate reductase [Actinomycetota bacterium]
MLSAFEWICEIEPPTTPDLMHVRHQIGVLSKLASAYLIPDNHVGRATVSSIAVAHEVDRMGGRAIACLNARDRNLLGFRRDLLTGAAYGVDEFLFVYGDDPVSGARTGQLTVRAMIDDLRRFSDEQHGQSQAFRAGVTTRLKPLPAWKRRADFLFVQVAFSLDDLIAWRETIQFDGSIYAGVMVLPSVAMARKLIETIPEITVPTPWLEAIERDRSAGVKLTCELAEDIAASGAFDGIHLIPGVRYRETAALLEGLSR